MIPRDDKRIEEEVYKRSRSSAMSLHCAKLPSIKSKNQNSSNRHTICFENKTQWNDCSNSWTGLSDKRTGPSSNCSSCSNKIKRNFLIRFRNLAIKWMGGQLDEQIPEHPNSRDSVIEIRVSRTQKHSQ